ncbi:alanine aminotransferase [Streptococcus pneumoniae]|nr:alanine aminotransferase [Streptococcus pneumoniae]
MFTDWFDQALLRQFIHGALGFGFMIFVVFPMEMEWLKGESHDGG